MSVEELRARINKLSSEIDLQESLVKKLKQDRSLAQRQLNAVLDPVARLPVEISSEIFMQSLAPIPQPGARLHTPMLLLSICHAWSAIALSTPDLWASIQINFPCAKGFTKVLPIWLQRARNRPLSISLCGDLGNLEPPALSILWEYGKQLKHLKVSDDCGDEDHDDVFVDLFGGTTPGPLPFLETVVIRDLVEGRTFIALQILELLRSASNIVECSFDCLDPLYGINNISEPVLVLPTLRRWSFGCKEYPEGVSEILNYVSLPRLEALSVSLSTSTISGRDLFSFFKRSAAPLQELVLVLLSFFRDSLQLHECLRLIHTLARLSIYWADSESVADLVAALADSPSLLPNLHRLTIQTIDHATLTDFSWRTLIRVLAARRTQLEIFDVEVPAADLLAAFRELVSEGMQIHIGTKERNFVVA